MQTREDLLITQRNEKITSYSLTSGLLNNHRTHECEFKKCMIQSCITWNPIFHFQVLWIIVAVFEWCTCKLCKNVVKKYTKKIIIILFWKDVSVLLKNLNAKNFKYLRNECGCGRHVEVHCAQERAESFDRCKSIIRFLVHLTGCLLFWNCPLFFWFIVAEARDWAT